jgi:hypothetical protein
LPSASCARRHLSPRARQAPACRRALPAVRRGVPAALPPATSAAPRGRPGSPRAPASPSPLDRVRLPGSFTTSRATQSESAGSTSGCNEPTGGIGSLMDQGPPSAPSCHRTARGRPALRRHHPDGVEIAPRTDLLAHRALGRHVARSAERGTDRREVGDRPRLARRLRDAEVGDLHPRLRADHDVLGLEVAIDHPVLLGEGQAAELQESIENPRTRSADPATTSASGGTAVGHVRNPGFRGGRVRWFPT